MKYFKFLGGVGWIKITYLKEAFKLIGKGIHQIGKLPFWFLFYAPIEFIQMHFILLKQIFNLLIKRYLKW